MKTAFETYFESLKGKEVAVLGLGVSNRPLVRLLLSSGCRVTGCDRVTREKLDEEVLELERQGCELRLGDTYLENIPGELVFRTPGMHPENPALQKLRAEGKTVTSEMEVFFEVCPCPIIAVTGSDGKTTTTTLISEMLKAEGKTVFLGGNIGTPLLPLTPQMQETDVAVVELSSFQLMDMQRSPKIAVMTNLAPNHLDVHKDMEEYVEAKKNIFRFQDESCRLVVNLDNAVTAPFVGNGETLTFSRLGKDATVRCEDGWILRDGEKVMKKDQILIPGEHNVENYMAAIAALKGIVSDESIVKVAETFGGVEHRIELVRIKDGVKFYNDSIASSPSRTIAGLKSFREKVLLIVGGYDKHIPFDVMGPEVCRSVKTLYLGGATGKAIAEAVRNCPEYAENAPKIVDCGDFYTAVNTAAADAVPGDIVLLSPASAAFDQFKNFMVRGNTFKKMVMEMK